MKREIKFRIWDGSKMEYSVLAGAMGVVYVNPANGGVNPRDTACITPFNTIYPDGIEVMQYTGILDKNGKEIYEGDIVRVNDQTYYGGDSWDTVVQFIKGCFYVCSIADFIKQNGGAIESVEEAIIMRKGIEVIGNIHDNPELVK